MNGSSERGGAAGSAAAARWLRWTLTALVALVMFAMMMLTTVDVAGRALFNAPIKGSAEIVSFLLALVVFAALPLVSWDQHHITVNLFERWFGPRLRQTLDALWTSVGTLVVSLIAYRMWVQGALMAEGQHITGALEWPIAPVAYVMSLLAALAAFLLAGLTAQKIGALVRGAPLEEPARSEVD